MPECRACIASIIRMSALLPSANSKDPTWDKVSVVIYAIIEINIGIACAAVVTLRPLYRRLRDAFQSRGPPANPPSSNDLSTPGRWRPGRRLRDHLDLISGETTQASSSNDSCDGKMELGEAVGRSLPESTTVISTTNGPSSSRPGTQEARGK